MCKICGRVWGVVEVYKLISVCDRIPGKWNEEITVYETVVQERVRRGAISTSQAVQDPVQCFIPKFAPGSVFRELPTDFNLCELSKKKQL